MSRTESGSEEQAATDAEEDGPTGVVETIFTTPEGSAPMEEVAGIEAIARQGLAGDRYAKGAGYYSGLDECEVTFIEQEAMAEIREEYGIDLADGRHRRNIVTSGVSVQDLLNAEFRVGEVVFEGTRPRPPCAHVEQVAEEKGVARALKNQRGGICASVVEGGELAVGDEIEALEAISDPDGLADAIRKRLTEQ
ncbi:MOSC domain-containing protein [Halobacteriales archaeon QS_3_64_16]|nr:MAG: MOSC domain-containing protein [Halobacteriales archaeon QS_3_64_16]